MPLHVEIRRGLRHAREFNLDLATVRAQVVDPWTRDEVVEFGDARWKPEEAKLTVLEGPWLDGPDLAFGQGWNSATKSATDVTQRLLATADTATLAVLGPQPHRAETEAAIHTLDHETVAWEAVRAEILYGAEVAADAVVIVLADDTPQFDVGLALGAFGAKAILTSPAGATPWNGLPAAIPLDPGNPAPLGEAVAERVSRRS